MFRRFILALGLAVALVGTAQAADPQTFKSENTATKFCKDGNIVWFNPESKIYFAPGSQFHGSTKTSDFTGKTFAGQGRIQGNEGE